MIDRKISQIMGERSRIYHYPGDRLAIFAGVVELQVSKSGTHYLTYSGGLAIVSAGWVWIEIQADGWSA